MSLHALSCFNALSSQIAKANTYGQKMDGKMITNDVYSLWLLKILDCNGHQRVSFSNAYIKTIPHHLYNEMKNYYGENVEITLDKKLEYVDLIDKGEIIGSRRTHPAECLNFISLFDTDEVLAHASSMTDKEADELLELESYKPWTVEKAQKHALALLNKFLRDCDTNFLEAQDGETNWAEIISVHLVKQLAEDNRIRIGVDNSYHSLHEKCPCPSKCGEKINHGDTSIGSLSVWHGPIDILVGLYNVAIKAIDWWSADEVKKDKGVVTKNGEHSSSTCPQGAKQVAIAQNISLSFLKKKDSENTLVPNILVGQNTIQIYFYDSEHDVLLETYPFPLDQLCFVPTIIAFWLTLNWRIFGTGLTREMVEAGFKSDFKTIMEKNRALKIYEDHLQFGDVKKDPHLESKYDVPIVVNKRPLGEGAEPFKKKNRTT